MAFTTGTATTYHDLLDKLRLYAVAQGWTQLRWTAPGSITATAELWLRGPGAGPDRQVFVGFQSGNDVTNGYYGWAMKGATSFDGALAFSLQPVGSPTPWFNLWQNSIPYWFYVNDRRIIVVAKVNTTYQSMYAGFFLPFALPTEYPFPLAIIGSYPTLDAYNLNNSGNRMFIDCGDEAGVFKRRGTPTWKEISNNSNSANAQYDAHSNYFGLEALIWPCRVTKADPSGNSTDWSQRNGFYKFRPNANNEYPLYQCHIIDPEAKAWVGALDGAYATPGFNRTTEQTVTTGGRTFRLFQNVQRSTAKDFFAIEEV